MQSLSIDEQRVGIDISPKSWFDPIVALHDQALQRVIQGVSTQTAVDEVYARKTLVPDQIAEIYALDHTVMFSSASVPNRHEMIGRAAVPSGMLLAPFSRPVFTTTSSDFYPPRCTQCRSFINVYCKLEGTDQDARWQCAVCRHVNKIDAGTSGVRSVSDVKLGLGWWTTSDGPSIALAHELYDVKKRSVPRDEDYTDDADDLNDATSPSMTSKPSRHSSHVFVIDDNLTKADLAATRAAIESLCNELPKDTRVSLITYSKVVSIYELTSSHFVLAKVIPGGHSLSTSEVFSLKRKSKLFTETIGNGGCERISLALAAMEEGAGAGMADGKPAALGVAIECALRITSGPRTNGRVFVFLAGAPNYGPGAIDPSAGDAEDAAIKEYYKVLGNRAAHRHIAIDLHCCGFTNFGSESLAPLSFPSGHIHVNHELNDNDRSAMMLANMKNSIQKTSRVDSVNPNLPDLETSDKYPSFELTNMQQDVCLSLYYDLIEDIPSDYIHIQFAIHLLDENDNRILRVITKRLKTTGNFDKFLETLNWNVVFTGQGATKNMSKVFNCPKGMVQKYQCITKCDEKPFKTNVYN
eukprot:gene7763-9107_t